MSDEITIIEARPESAWSQLRAAWIFRSFYGYLFWEITIRKFRDTMLGFWWLILRPLIPAIVTIILFSSVVRLDTGNLPYPIFLLTSLIVWNAFQTTLVFMPRTLLWMRAMMRRTYFPRILVPTASIGPTVLEIGVNTAMLAVCMIFYWLTTGNAHLVIGPWLLLFPVCVALALIIGVAGGMVLSVVALVMRDIVFTVPYFAQIVLLASPVIYPMGIVPAKFHAVIFLLNPMAILLETARFSVTGLGQFQFLWFLIAVAWAAALLMLATAFFLRAERFLADHL